MTEQTENKEVAQAKEEKAKALQDLRESRVRGQRSLIIHVLLMFLVSIVVFVIGSYFFIVPRVIRHRLDARHTAAQVASLKKEVAFLRGMRAPATVQPAPAKAEPAAKAESAAKAEPAE